MKTSRFALPLLQAGQAQKEVWHNEALARVDALLHPAIEGMGLDVPPAAPAPGQAWIVGASPTGSWSGHAGTVAGWTEGGWRFVTPRDGMSVYCRDTGLAATCRDGAWISGELRGERLVIAGETVVVGRQPAIAEASGGAVIDIEARAGIAAILAALRSHGLIAT